MSQPVDNHELSIMEDLDPEPPGRARTVRTREVWLGVLLLLGVLGWAGWQWWHGERLRNDYELGSRAVIAQQWDEARAYFQAADGYRDASTRAQDVEKKIEERNKQYEIASVHAEAGEWAVVLKAAQEVAAIQPHYKGLDALTTEAERRVYRDALNGSIARRVLDDPALYYRDAEKWVRLEESDRWSRIRAYGEDGTFLYDVPGSGWAGPPTPTPTVAPGLPQQTEVGSPELVGRRLMTVSFDGVHGPVFHKLSLDPSRYIYYVMSTAGVWGVHVSNMEYAGVPMEGLYVGSELDYEAYDSNRTSTITVAPNAVLVGFGAQGNHILLAEFDPSAPGAGGVKLYAAAPDGTQARLIYSTTGSIKSALLSPDERFVLVTTIEPQEGTNGKMAAVLLDLLGDAEPRTLMKADARVTFSNFTVSVNGPSGLRAAFLRRGRFADMVIVTINDGSTGTQVKLIDPEHPQWSRTIAEAPAQGSDYTSVDMPVYEQADGNWLVIPTLPRLSNMNSQEPVTVSLSIVQYDIALAQWTYVPARPTTYKEVVLSRDRTIGSRPNLSGFILVGDRLIYEAFFFNPEEFTSIFYSVPLADLNKKEPALTEVFKVTQAPERHAPTQSWFPGPNMFVYTDEQHALHARTYDGAIDLVLERGVDFVESDWYYGY